MQASLPPSRKSSRGGAKKSIASLSSEEPSLVLRTSRNDDDVALAADPLFAAEAELHLALEHPPASTWSCPRCLVAEDLRCGRLLPKSTPQRCWNGGSL